MPKPKPPRQSEFFGKIQQLSGSLPRNSTDRVLVLNPMLDPAKIRAARNCRAVDWEILTYLQIVADRYQLEKEAAATRREKRKKTADTSSSGLFLTAGADRLRTGKRNQVLS